VIDEAHDLIQEIAISALGEKIEPTEPPTSLPGMYGGSMLDRVFALRQTVRAAVKKSPPFGALRSVVTTQLSNLPNMATASYRAACASLVPGVVATHHAPAAEWDELTAGWFDAAAAEAALALMDSTAQDLGHAAVRHYEATKSMLAGESFLTPVYFGFSGLDLDPGVSHKTPWGILYHVESEATGTRLFNPYEPTTTAIMALAVPVSVRLRPNQKMRNGVWTDPGFPAVTFSLPWQRIRDIFPLAVLLSCPAEHLTAPRLLWGAPVVPWEGVSHVWAQLLFQFPGEREAPLSQTEIEEACMHWGPKLDMAFGSGWPLALAGLADATHADRVERLMLAVSAWESLTGAKGETVLRVTAGMARLLGKSPADRAELRRKLAKIYDLRSEISHGARLADGTWSAFPEAREFSSDALKYAIDALKALLVSYPELLALAPDQRSQGILLS